MLLYSLHIFQLNLNHFLKINNQYKMFSNEYYIYYKLDLFFC